ncbi:MAG TPA: glycosyltransferase family 2 protein, partial [Persephonella sp.]|nr:glycosyltransferase family 2 protein [Persephonella sp.]
MGKVSVVIPVYNGERFIKQAVESVLNQSYKNTQIVIVNDCSTDKTEEVVFKNFKDLINKKIIY